MGLFNKYPYTDFHELNLDWVLARIRENEIKIDNFINLNTIKYSNPIGWNITSQYEANTVVIDQQTGNAYISTKAVPSGVSISNIEYWTQIFNYANELEKLRRQIAHDEENNTTATEPRAVGDLVFVRGVLYRIIAPMIAGDSYVVGSNCEKTTIEEYINAEIDKESSVREGADLIITQALNNEVQTRSEEIDAIMYKFSHGTFFDIYLSPNGNDSNGGGINDPIKTLSRAQEIAEKEISCVNVLHFEGGTYEGGTLTGLDFQFRASGNVNFSSDVVLRKNAFVLIGIDDQNQRDEATYTFSGINGIYLNGSHLVTNCPLVFTNCQNAIISDCGSFFVTHEYNTEITFGENVANGVEASRSFALGGSI